MGDLNQLDFVKSMQHSLGGPFLEVGSKQYGNTPDFRSLFPGAHYTGVDMEQGEGVDTVLDMTHPIDTLRSQLSSQFGTIFCFSVFEHCDNPFAMARNITDLLAPGGRLFVGAPFSFTIHGYPQDYWRFTPDGFKLLFPDIAFDDTLSNYSSEEGEIFPAGKQEPKLYITRYSKTSCFKLGLLRGPLFYLMMKTRLLPKAFQREYVYLPLNLNMTGTKRTA